MPSEFTGRPDGRADVTKPYNDTVKNESSPGTLIWKHPGELFPVGCVLKVGKGEQAVIADGEETARVFPAGTHRLDADSCPFVKRQPVTLPDGAAAFRCGVFFLRSGQSREMRWGTAVPVEAFDPVLKPTVGVGARGYCEYRVMDGSRLIGKLTRTGPGFLPPERTAEELVDGLVRDSVILILAERLKSLSENLPRLETETERLAGMIRPELEEALLEYGLKLCRFRIEGVRIADEEYRDAADIPEMSGGTEIYARRGDRPSRPTSPGEKEKPAESPKGSEAPGGAGKGSALPGETTHLASDGSFNRRVDELLNGPRDTDPAKGDDPPGSPSGDGQDGSEEDIRRLMEELKGGEQGGPAEKPAPRDENAERRREAMRRIGELRVRGEMMARRLGLASLDAAAKLRTEQGLSPAEEKLKKLGEAAEKAEPRPEAAGSPEEEMTRRLEEEARNLEETVRVLEKAALRREELKHMYEERSRDREREEEEARQKGGRRFAFPGLGIAFTGIIGVPALIAEWLASRRRGKDAGVAGGSIERIDRVGFSALSNHIVKKNNYYALRILMYEEARRSEVDRIKKETPELSKETRAAAPVNVARGQNVTVRLSSPSAVIENSELTLPWEGGVREFAFSYLVPPDIRQENVLITARIYIEQVLATVLQITVPVKESRASLSVSRRDIMEAFMSYSSEDRTDVLKIAQGMRCARPDLNLFLDVESLRTGENWHQAINDRIGGSDTLYLCWSRSAKKSEWVNYEWRYAYDTKGPVFIEPIALEPPALCRPPEELNGRHFNDVDMLMRLAEEQIKQMKKSET